MTVVSESREPAPPHGWQRAVVVAAALAAIAVAWMAWSHFGRLAIEKELAAKAVLADLGALVAMDSDRKHVNSVNLSTLKSPDSLDEAVGLLPALGAIKSLNSPLGGRQIDSRSRPPQDEHLTDQYRDCD